jgi:hypothetical protein
MKALSATACNFLSLTPALMLPSRSSYWNTFGTREHSCVRCGEY